MPKFLKLLALVESDGRNLNLASIFFPPDFLLHPKTPLCKKYAAGENDCIVRAANLPCN
jgi:hypothetical protein